MKPNLKLFAVTNTILGVAYLLLFLLVGLKAGIVSIILFLVMFVLHLAAGIGTLKGADWGTGSVKFFV
jgi:hypothetical protein